MKIVIGITGASGAIYAYRLIERLKQENVQPDVIFSENAKKVWQWELGDIVLDGVRVFDNKDFFAPMASGSAIYDSMVIAPCSMGSMAKIASGVSDNLLTRAADVMLKERRKLILVPREMPYSLTHIENMKKITLAGGIIIPASPSFYSRPQSITQLVDTVIDKILIQLGLPVNYHWGE